jgi:hypothetical protein
MGANQLENFEIVKVNRRDIHGADYNPRKISESARKKLRDGLKKYGLVQPIIVNKPTMNVVGGHKRLEEMDTIIRKPDYELHVAMINVSEKDEVSINVFLNNQSAMGEWDVLALQDIKGIFPDIDYEADMGFDESDINILFGRQEEEQKLIEEQAAAEEFTPDTFRETKKKIREKAKSESKGGDSYNLAESDYVIQIVFPNNHEKHEFMRKIRKPEKETYLKSSILLDIYNHVYDISVFGGKE